MLIISSIKAILARVLLGVHALVTVWRTTVMEGNLLYWAFLLILVGSFVDLAYVITKRKGAEWKWFSPSIFFYLATTIPCIWLMELNRLEHKRQGVDNVTVNGNDTAPGLDQLNPALAKFASDLGGKFSGTQWISFLEQAMLLFLIIARWMLPVAKEDISRDQLSQLLLVYLGLAADILELFAIFEEPQVLEDRFFIIIILAFWSWSLMQFTLVLTATRARGFSANNKVEAMEADVEPENQGCFFCDGEIWSILIMCCMLDLPFLSLRLTAMIHYDVATYTIYFFTCKNVLVVLLQGYRLMIVCGNQYAEAHGSKKQVESKNGSVNSVSEQTSHSIELDIAEKNAKNK